MARKKYQKKYGSDMQVLLDALAADELTAFVAGLSAGSPAAVERFEQGRVSLTKPRRVCVELFLCEGETFDSIARRTGYLVDDIPVHIAAGVRQCVPLCNDPDMEEEGTEMLTGERSEPGGEPPPPAANPHSQSSFDPPLAAPRNRRRIWLWWALAAVIVVAVGVYLYSMKAKPVPVQPPVVEKPVPERPVVANTEAIEEPVQDSTVVAKPSGRARIVTISRGDDGEYISVPLIGQRQYDDYLSNAMMPLDEEASRGEVTMTFRVNRYGRPSGIRVISILTHEANHEAIRLLANGPEWAETEGQVTLTIRFL